MPECRTRGRHRKSSFRPPHGPRVQPRQGAPRRNGLEPGIPMKPSRVIRWTVGAMLALAAVKLLQGQHAIDAALRENIGRQARLELELVRLNAEAELAREHREKLSRRMDRIEEARH